MVLFGFPEFIGPFPAWNMYVTDIRDEWSSCGYDTKGVVEGYGKLGYLDGSVEAPSSLICILPATTKLGISFLCLFMTGYL